MQKLVYRAPTMREMLFFVAVVSLTGTFQYAQAQSASDKAKAGWALAEHFCSQCHVVAPNDQGTWTDAPTFDAIANREGTTAAKLSAIIQQPHVHMLNTSLPPGEADAIAAYIISLRKS